MGLFASKQKGADGDSEGRGQRQGKSAIDLISDTQLDDFKEAFNQYDKDGSGTINKGEMKQLLASVGQHPTDEELTDMINAADADGTGAARDLALPRPGPARARRYTHTLLKHLRPTIHLLGCRVAQVISISPSSSLSWHTR
jgi:hypothetical protein